MKNSRLWAGYMYVTADNCLDGLALWCSPGMRETRVQFPVEAYNFSFRLNSLLHLPPNYGIHWTPVCSVRSMRAFFPGGGGECHGRQLPRWSSSMMLNRNARDWGLICPSESTVICMYKYSANWFYTRRVVSKDFGCVGTCNFTGALRVISTALRYLYFLPEGVRLLKRTV